MRLNLITEPSHCAQLPPSDHCAPSYCILEPGSNRVAVGLRNVSAKAITIPSWTVVGQLQQARMVPGDNTSKSMDNQGSTGGKGDSWNLDQLHLEQLDSWTVGQQQSAKELLVESAYVFSKNGLDLGKCNILKHASKLHIPNHSRKDTKGYHLTCMRR